MTIRKRRNPSSGFRMPVPYDGMHGDHAPIGRRIDLTRVALMQVLEEHDDYLVCRGYDPEAQRFFNEVAVAKPMVLQKTPWDGKTYTIDGKEVTFDSPSISYPYFVGDILAAVKPETKIGETPGAFNFDEDLETPYEDGIDILEMTIVIMHEEDDEETEDVDESEKVIAWMDLNVAGRGVGVQCFELTETLAAGSTAGATAYRRTWDGAANAGEGGYETGTTEITVKDTREVGYYGSAGAKGACIMKTADNGPFGEICDMECP